VRDPKKIVDKLLKLGYNQKEIAALIDVSPSTISRLLSGATPHLSTCKALWDLPAETLRTPKV